MHYGSSKVRAFGTNRVPPNPHCTPFTGSFKVQTAALEKLAQQHYESTTQAQQAAAESMQVAGEAHGQAMEEVRLAGLGKDETACSEDGRGLAWGGGEAGLVQRHRGRRQRTDCIHQLTSLHLLAHEAGNSKANAAAPVPTHPPTTHPPTHPPKYVPPLGPQVTALGNQQAPLSTYPLHPTPSITQPNTSHAPPSGPQVTALGKRLASNLQSATKSTLAATQDVTAQVGRSVDQLAAQHGSKGRK